MGSGVAQLDTWTEAAEITSEQKNFLLLSALYKFLFTCVYAHMHTHTHMGGLGLEPREQQEGQAADQMRAGGWGAGLGPPPTQPFLRGLGPGLRQRECLRVGGCWGAEETARRMSLSGIRCCSFLGVGVTCGQGALPVTAEGLLAGQPPALRVLHAAL